MSALRPQAGLDALLEAEQPTRIRARLTAKPGELVALVGPSGSGKTTILRLIAGLARQTGGYITTGAEPWFDHARRINLPPQRRRIGLVFQDYALFPHLTAADNIAIAVPGHDRTGKRRRATELLKLVNLDGLDDRRPADLSGGQRQRVAIARALARDPHVLLLDEPFSAVDQMTRERLKLELTVLRRTLDIPIVLVTHDLAEALALADTLVVLYRGETLQAGPPDDVRLRPVSPNVARLIGETNVFRGVVETPSRHDTPGRITWAGGSLEARDTGPFAAGQPVSWMIPADHIVLHRRGRPSAGDRENPVSCRVTALSTLGVETAVTVQVASADTGTHAALNFRLPTHAARRNDLAPGVDAVVSLLATGLHLMPAAE